MSKPLLANVVSSGVKFPDTKLGCFYLQAQITHGPKTTLDRKVMAVMDYDTADQLRDQLSTLLLKHPRTGRR